MRRKNRKTKISTIRCLTEINGNAVFVTFDEIDTQQSFHHVDGEIRCKRDKWAKASGIKYEQC